jgi:glycosyltransferase involved in cell wall biosynthesis
MVKSTNLCVLHISKRSFYHQEGLTYSIPNQVYHQNQFAEVYWYNANQKKYDYGEKDFYPLNINDYPIYKFRKLLRFIKRPDLVIFQELYYLEYLYIALFLTHREIPYIIVPRGCLTKIAQMNKKYFKGGANFFYQHLLKKAIAIHFLSENEKNNTYRKWHTEEFVIPNGIRIPKKVKEWGEQKPKEYTGIFIGRKSIYIKGLDLLLKACGKVRSELISNNIHFVLYGPCTNRELIKLQTIIHDNNLDDIVKLHDGIFEKEKYTALLESDFFLLTSRSEGHPIGLLEALSVGLPSLVTQGTTMREEIVENNAGWGADTSIESIEAALRHLIRDIDKLPEMSANALQLARRYNWNTIAERSINKYKDLLDKSTR